MASLSYCLQTWVGVGVGTKGRVPCCLSLGPRHKRNLRKLRLGCQIRLRKRKRETCSLKGRKKGGKKRGGRGVERRKEGEELAWSGC